MTIINDKKKKEAFDAEKTFSFRGVQEPKVLDTVSTVRFFHQNVIINSNNIYINFFDRFNLNRFEVPG